MIRPGWLWFALLCFSLAGCSDVIADASDDGRVVSREGSSSAIDRSAGPGIVDDDRPSPGLDVLRVALARPETMAPAELSIVDQEAVIVADLLYDGLTEAAGTEGRLDPALAESWDASDDFTRWAFTLDVDRIDASSVVESFSALGDGPVSAPGALAHVVSVEAAEPGTVVFTLDRPDAGLAWLVSGVGFSIVGPHGAPTSGYEVTVDDSEMMVLRPGEGSDGPEVALRWESSADDAYDTLTLGLVDAAVAPPEALHDARSRFGAVPAARAVSRFYGLNLGSPRLADDRLRRAVVHAVDRDEATAEGTAVPVYPADGVVAPTVAGYRPGGCAEGCVHDPGRARSLLAEARRDGAPPDVLRIAIGSQDQAAADIIADDLAAVGFEVDVRPLNPGELARTIAAGEAELFAFGWVAPAGSVDAVVPALFGSGSAANAVRLRSARVDALIADATTTGDDRDRWDLLLEAHDVALSEAAVIPLAVAKSHFVAAPQAQHVVVRADGSIDPGRGQ